MWFSGIFFLILSLIVEVYLWWKLQASLIFLSGRTCTIGGWLNTFLPHCTCSIQISTASEGSDATFVWTNAPFCINQNISVSLSVEEVQTFLSLIAEERIQQELDGAMRNEKALCKYFLHFVYRVCFLFIFLKVCFASIKNNLIE